MAGVPFAMAELLKPTVTEQALDELEEMRQETETIIATSAKLIRELEFLMEENRQHRLVQEALRAEMAKNRPH